MTSNQLSFLFIFFLILHASLIVARRSGGSGGRSFGRGRSSSSGGRGWFGFGKSKSSGSKITSGKSSSSNTGHVPYAPPPYPGYTPYFGRAPPPYPGFGTYNPHQPPPPYPGLPPNSQINNAANHPRVFTGYGGPVYYKDRSGFSGSDVAKGLALWQLSKHNSIHHHHYYYNSNYHDTMREKYTTRVTPTQRQSTGPGAYNVLEMTNYFTKDEKGVISSTEGNMTCLAIYNAKSISDWHSIQVKDFHRQFPDDMFPLYVSTNQTRNFTVTPTTIQHKQPISLTCCGTSNGSIEISSLINGKNSNVNCINHSGYIPIYKLTYVKINKDNHTTEQPKPTTTTTTTTTTIATTTMETTTTTTLFPTEADSLFETTTEYNKISTILT